MCLSYSIIAGALINSMKRQYEVIDHTADLGLRAFGETREVLLTSVARAMFDQIADLSIIREDLQLAVVLGACNLEELLVAFLSVLIYLSTRFALHRGKFII